MRHTYGWTRSVHGPLLTRRKAPAYTDATMIRIAAVSDLHVKAGDVGTLRERFADVNTRADLLLLPGDLTDHGSLEEAHLLVTGLADITIPVFAVLGNHDYA